MTRPRHPSALLVHWRLPDGWTACTIGRTQRVRRTTDPARVTCHACLEVGR